MTSMIEKPHSRRDFLKERCADRRVHGAARRGAPRGHARHGAIGPR